MRIQSAYVSDKEILNVVDFLSEQSANSKVDFYTVEDGKGNIEAKAYDEYFEEAGRFVIEKGKASIGMLQRFFKVGFNRANEIMNQLCEVGVVGEELGTKPREVLITLEQFEEFLEENI